ncbi:MAG TPA: OmpA family protein [Pirellulales bacterium]|nr:OmpA family protein [Pirellulales bacterium]
MNACRLSLAAFAAPLWLCALGCQFVPKGRLDAAESLNRALVEQKDGLIAENENLKAHARRVEAQKEQAEEELAELVDGRSPRGHSTGGHGRVVSGKQHGAYVPLGVSQQLTQLSKRHPAMEYDPRTGASKLDIDVLFDSAEAKLRPESHIVLDEFAGLLKSPEAHGLRVMVIGHADDRRIVKSETRRQYPDNWHLSAARALAVAEYLEHAGVRENQIGIASFGRHQPVSPNTTASDRQRNRRVEIYVTGSDVPIVGWSETERKLR